MNEIVSRIFKAGDKFMPEMYLRKPGFTYSARGPFTENKERILKFKQTGYKRHIYKNKLDKAYFQEEIRFLLLIIDIHSKYVWIIPLKDKIGITITHPFQNF